MVKRILLYGALVATLLAITVIGALSAPEPPWTLPTNCSGLIKTTGVAQQIIAAGVKHGYQLQNLTSTAMSWSDVTSTPTVGGAGSWSLNVSTTPFQTSPTFAPSGAVFIVGTISSTFACEVW